MPFMIRYITYVPPREENVKLLNLVGGKSDLNFMLKCSFQIDGTWTNPLNRHIYGGFLVQRYPSSGMRRPGPDTFVEVNTGTYGENVHPPQCPSLLCVQIHLCWAGGATHVF